MKHSLLLTAVLSLFTVAAFADDETIEKVMKQGMKGKTSPHANVIAGTATPEETKKLAEMIHTLTGTKAPVGDQADYDKKIAALVAGIDKIAGGDKSPAAIAAYKEAGNCKACHEAHKPKE
jgi:hypothetical protein